MAWRNGHAMRALRFAWLPLLSGCAQKGYWLLHPKGAIARTEWHTTVLDAVVMGCVVLVAGGLVAAFLWRYRVGNTSRRYDPTFTASLVIEVLVWGVPLLVVGYLSYVSVKSVLATNPYDPLALHHALARRGHADQDLAHRAPPTRVDTAAPGTHAGRPLRVQVVTTDWQWVFIYPRQRLATVDELVVPVGTAVKFDLTSATVVNDFFIPQLVGEIDIMPGMRTKQALIASRMGVYHGYSDDFSGGGFSWMGFSVRVTDRAQFQRWVRRVRAAHDPLSYARFAQIAQPTINVAQRIRHFSEVQKGLFDHVIERAMAGRVYRTPLAMTEDMTKPMKVRLIP
ncbi:MAG: COX aromatic rich motif-containing protein [Acidiferrobacter sp.]